MTSISLGEQPGKGHALITDGRDYNTNLAVIAAFAVMTTGAGYNNKSVLILILEIALAVGVAGVMVYWIVRPARKRGEDGGGNGGGGAKQ